MDRILLYINKSWCHHCDASTFPEGKGELTESDSIPASWVIRRNEQTSRWQLVNPLPGNHTIGDQSSFLKIHALSKSYLSDICDICEWSQTRDMYKNHNGIHSQILTLSLLILGKDFFPAPQLLLNLRSAKSEYLFFLSYNGNI